MRETALGNTTRTSQVLLVACAVAAAWGIWSWNYGLDFRDEGFLWYGVQRTLYGEVPVRDFMAYDIGRYYIAAAIGFLVGDGLAPLRWTSVICEAVLLVMALHIVMPSLPRRGVVNALCLLFFAVLVVLWVFPYYKVYDHLAAVAVVQLALVALRWQRPDALFWIGAGVGFVALIGRNHGVYGVMTILLVLSGLIVTRSVKWPAGLHMAFCFGLGVLAGYTPNWLMALWVPGYLNAMIATVQDMIAQGATNLPLPVPWPWKVRLGEGGGLIAISELMIGLGFCLLLAVPATALILLSAKKVAEPMRLPLAASAAAAVPYAHYAFSRPDSVHLSLAILPTILAIFLMLPSLKPGHRLVSMLGLLGFTICAVGFSQPAIKFRILGVSHEVVNIGATRIFVEPSKARLWRWLDEVLVEQKATTSFLALPNLPSLHADRRMAIPIWEIYALTPRTTTFQNKEIETLAAKPPALIILSNDRLDGRFGARFSDFHRDTFDWIKSNYIVLDSLGAPSGIQDMMVFVRKQGGSL